MRNLTVVIVVLLMSCQRLRADGDNELNEETSYGERLVESSHPLAFHSFNSAANREQREETSIYSSGINAILNSDGFLNQMEKYGGNPKYTPQGPVEMAVHTKKTVEVIPVRFEEPKDGEPQVIEISPYEVPLSIVFKTQTQKINVNQEHKTEAAEEVQETSSEEEPHRVVHNVYRPVIQEVTEVIQPFRKVLQKVEPVIEEMKTIISKAAPNGEAVSGAGAQQQQQHQLQQQQQLQLTTSQLFGQHSFSQPAANTGNMIQIHRQADFRYGGNSGGLAHSGFMPLAYGSELVKKMVTPPASLQQQQEQPTSAIPLPSLIPPTKFSTEHKEIPRRFHITSQNVTLPSKSESTVFNVTELKADDSPASQQQYNTLIKDYIEQLLEQKKSQNKQTNGAGGSGNGLGGLNPNSIKMFNIPLKHSASDVKPTKMAKDGTAPSPKYKIIKEFRISIDDIKKELKKNKENKAKQQLRQQQQQRQTKMIPLTFPLRISSHERFRPMPRRNNFAHRAEMNPSMSSSNNRPIYSPKRFGNSPSPRPILVDKRIRRRDSGPNPSFSRRMLDDRIYDRYMSDLSWKPIRSMPMFAASEPMRLNRRFASRYFA